MSDHDVLTVQRSAPSAPAKRSRFRGMRRYPWLSQVFVLVMAVPFLVPIYILVNLSLKNKADSVHPLVPVTNPTFQNFIDAWEQAGLGGALLNGLIITVASVAILVVIASLASYTIARSTRRWANLAFYGFLLGMIVPFQLAMFPLFSTLRALDLIGTLQGMVIYHVGHLLPFAVFMYTSFLRRVDREYEEAAEIDGASRLRVFWSVVLPMVRPVTGTLIILNGISTWNDFLGALIYLSGQTKTVPVALYGFVSSYYSNWNLVFAGLLVSALPVLIIYFFMQNTIIKGFAGGLKG